MAVYYIAQTGLTTNVGTIPTSPWSLPKVSSFAFSPGDNILFNKGDILTGTTNFTSSGTLGNPITFDLYGNSLNNTILDGLTASTNPVLKFNNVSYVNVKNLVVRNSSNSTAIIYLNGCHDISLTNLYINTGVRGVAAHGCGSNTIINNNYFGPGIADPNLFNGNGGGNAVQLSNCVGSGISISFNQYYEPVPNNLQGDLFSVFQSSGISVHGAIQINGNKIKGGNDVAPPLPGEGGFCAIVLGDVGQSYFQQAIGNFIIDGGFVGIMISGGQQITVSGNSIYGSSGRTLAAAGMQYINNSQGFGGSYQASTGVTMANNFINWRDQNNAYDEAWYDGNTHNITTGPNSGGTYTLAQPSGWTTNGTPGVPNLSIQPTLLLDTVWTGTPWNTPTIPIINYVPSNNIYTTGVLISPLLPVNVGGIPTGYTISPSLPSGLNFNITSGIISGTPAISSLLTTYTIIAYNSLGNSSTTINITIALSGMYIIFSGRRIAFR